MNRFSDVAFRNLPGGGLQVFHKRSRITITFPMGLSREKAAMAVRARVEGLLGTWKMESEPVDVLADADWKRGLHTEAKGFRGENELQGQEEEIQGGIPQ